MSSIAVAFYQSSPLGNLWNQTLSLATHPQGINVQSDSVESLKNCWATTSFPVFQAVGPSFMRQNITWKHPTLGKKKCQRPEWWLTAVISALRKQRQEENGKFKTSPGYIVKWGQPATGEPSSKEKGKSEGKKEQAPKASSWHCSNVNQTFVLPFEVHESH